MIQARIHNGRVESKDPIPLSWEGLAVKIEPLTPDDPLGDLEQRLAELHALGPIEADADEHQVIAGELKKLDDASR